MEDLEDLSGRVLGEFFLCERIDQGGFGALYRGEQLLLGREVAVKVMRRRGHDQALWQVQREALLAARLDHPYAAHVYSFGVERDDGLLWIAMELVHGVTLEDWLAEHGPMPLEVFVPFFERVAAVVHVAHERGIVHRDLKPANVMVIERAGELLPKLLDFGVAQLDETAAIPERIRGTAATTQTGDAIGTPAYMAPERWGETAPAGAASDVYALGVLAYEAIAGRRPFAANTLEDYARQHREASVPSLGASRLDRVIERALAKHPQDRWASAVELAAALRTTLRAQVSEQIRFSARQWQDRARPNDLLWRGRELSDFERWTRHTSAASIEEPVASFLAASQRYARRGALVRGLAVGMLATIAVAAFNFREALHARMAAVAAESASTAAEVEQGRQALLHDETAEAELHLGEAFRRGDRSPGTAFMLARAQQPRRAELARLPAAAGRMWSASFSPDGQRIVTGDDRAAQVWDADGRRLLLTLPHGDTVYQATYTADGASLVTVCGDGAVRAWRASNGSLERTLRPAAGPARRYAGLAMPASGAAIAAIDLYGGTVDVWDARTGAALAELHAEPLEFPVLAASADGRWLAASGGGELRVYDTATWKQTFAVSGRARGAAFSPDGSRLIVGTAGGDAAIWNVATGAREHHLREVGEAVERVAFSPDGLLAVTASRDGAEQVWRAATGELQAQLNVLHGKVKTVEFDASSRLVLAASAGGAIVVADAEHGLQLATLEGHGQAIWSAHFDASARHVVSASWDGSARVWDATSPYRQWASASIDPDCGVTTGVDPDARVIAVSCRGRSTQAWDTARGTRLAELPEASALPAVSADGTRAAIARGAALDVYELPGGRRLATIQHAAAVTAVAFARGGHDLISGAADGQLLVTREGAGAVALPRAAGSIDAVALLVDGRAVAVDAERRLRFYGAAAHAVTATLETSTRISALRLSPDSRRLVTLPSERSAALPPQLWDMDGQRLVMPLLGHLGLVFSARFVGGELVTAGADGSVRRWDPVTGYARAVYRGGPRFLVDATIDPTGTIVVAGGGLGGLRFWDLEGGRQLWTLQAHASHVVGVHFEGDELVTRAIAGDLARWRIPLAAK